MIPISNRMIAHDWGNAVHLYYPYCDANHQNNELKNPKKLRHLIPIKIKLLIGSNATSWTI